MPLAIDGPHPDGVCQVFGEASERERLSCDVDEVLVVVVEANLPCGSLAGLRPFQRCRLGGGGGTRQADRCGQVGFAAGGDAKLNLVLNV